MGNFLLVAVVAIAIIAYTNRTKLAAVGNLGAAMPQGINLKLVTGALAMVTVVGLAWWFWEDITALSFFWKLMLFVPIIFLGWRLSKGHKFTLGSSLFWFGVTGITVVLLVSNFGKEAEVTVNRAEASGLSGLFDDCIDRDRVEAGGYFTLRKGCANQSIETPVGFDPRFHIEDGRFPGAFGEWVTSAWDEHRGNTVNFTNNKWPEGVDEVVVRMVSVEQAAEIDAAAEQAVLSDADRAIEEALASQ